MADDAAVRTWLANAGFADDDLRSSTTFDNYTVRCPMARACEGGELSVCKWLHENGAAADLSKADNDGCTPMYIACHEGQLSVCKWLFEVGAAADITQATNLGCTPMWAACELGHLSVCKWLFEVGAASDISKASNRDETPIRIACQEGELSVCKWLFEVGAAADITKADNDGYTPMYVACQLGHLLVCKWLLEVGAAADISKANKNSITPMYIACKHGHLSVCKWLFEVGAAADITKARNNGKTPLRIAFEQNNIFICHFLILNGALSDPYPEADDDHINQNVVERDLLPAKKRPALLAWAQAAVAASLSFRSTIVMGTFYPESATATDLLRRTLIATGNAPAQADTILEFIPDEINRTLMLQQLRPVPALTLLRCQAGALELIADFLGGVLRERELRNARELADVLVGLSSGAAIS
jgi:ankyrin repeat protein